MWEHPATRANVAILRERGVVVLDPHSGRLTGTDTGPGRLPEPEEIFTAAVRLLRRAAQAGPGDPTDAPEPADLAGLRVAVSAGGTREPLDPVRYLGNRSSGRQGLALAAAAAARGATVELVAANVSLPTPAGVTRVDVGSAAELRLAMLAAAPRCDVLVMAAAVADFRPAEVAENKIKKRADSDDAPVVRLVRNPDILAELVLTRGRTPHQDGPDRQNGADRRSEQTIVGFAAETGDADGDVLTHAKAKLATKGCDLLVVNDVSAGKVFGREDTEVSVLDADGAQVDVPAGSKDAVADAVWDAVLAWRRHRARYS
jgi:phosphopantothenoylcysteine decarboxylase/phosphopantothenate--cysteine ligase